MTSKLKCPFCGKICEFEHRYQCLCHFDGNYKMWKKLIEMYQKLDTIANMEQRLCIDDPVDKLDDVLKIAKDNLH